MTGHSSTDTRRVEFIEALDEHHMAVMAGNVRRIMLARENLVRLFNDAATAVQGGAWVMVPREPTEEMWTAGREPLRFRDAPFPAMMMKQTWWTDRVGKPREDGFLPKGAWAELIWNAMLSAAPKPEAVAGDGKDGERVTEWLEREAWGFLRNVLNQGMAIQMDYQGGKYETYEHLSARLDEAARERCDQMVAAINNARTQEPR